MRRHRVKSTEQSAPPGELTWEALALAAPWQAVLHILAPGPRPRPVQAQALGPPFRVLSGRRNLIVAAGTNSGKSLVGLLVLLDAVRRGQRAVLLEPLRALAREKFDELRRLAGPLGQALGRPLRVRLTTGDTRLEGESIDALPPEKGEILVATPERLEAVLRRRGVDRWLARLGAVCADEAHLLGDPRRGPVLEHVLTSLLDLPTPPRLVLLSASLGDTERGCRWLAPCDALAAAGRWPPLELEVWEREPAEKADELLARAHTDLLVEDEARLLFFVYTTRTAEALAQALGGLPYHARLSAARRAEVRASFEAGTCRCVVATTALALGVNLPATHVLVRDAVFPGVGALSAAQLRQMLGRAGRGDRGGFAAVLAGPGDGERLARELSAAPLPELASALDGKGDPAPVVLGHLVRHGEKGLSQEAAQGFFARSLGGSVLAAQVPGVLAELSSPEQLLLWRDGAGVYRPTVLGERAARSLLPLDLARGVGQLVRDLLQLGDDNALTRWAEFDSLLVVQWLAPPAVTRRVSGRVVEQVDGWLDARGCPSLLFGRWVRQGAAAALAGSLGLVLEESAARAAASGAGLRAAVLLERGGGRTARELEEEWGLLGLEGEDERWRDEVLWLLGGLARLLEVRSFYYHLREVCQADAGRVRLVKGELRRWRADLHRLSARLARG